MRARITLWVLAILTVIYVSLALVYVLFHRQSVQLGLSETLAESASRLVAQHGPSPPADPPHDATWGPLRVLLIEPDGTVASSSGFGASEDPAALAAAVLAEAGGRATQGPVSFEVAGFVLGFSPGAGGHSAAVAVPANRVSQKLTPVVTDLLVALLISMLSTGIATWSMSGVAVRPLRQVREFAEEMSAETVAEGLEFDVEDTSPEVESMGVEIAAAMDRLEDGYDRQARFLANVSHELKTPISVIRTEADVLLAGDASPEDHRAFARSTSEEMRRLGKMVESFLLLTRLRHGSAQIRAKRHDPNELLMAAFEHTNSMAKQYKVTLDPMLHDGPADAEIEGNADLLQTAIGNLIRNAIRFSPERGRVEITCQATGRQVGFGVRDHGPGVPAELIGRLFEPFTQADEERRRGRGSGLGLQIAQGIAELHGGKISVENLDHGCRFTLSIPNTAETDEQPAPT